MLEYPAKWEKDDDFYYIEFIDIPEAFTQGETMEELLDNAGDVLTAIIKCMFEESLEIPMPSKVNGENIVYIKVSSETAPPVLIKNYRKSTNSSQGDIAQKS